MAKSWGKCDFKQLKSLQKKMEKLEKINLDKFYEECAKELAARLLSKVIKRTPVGKRPKFDGPKTVKVKSRNGKSKSFLTAQGAIQEQYWSGYMGGTLRRGWTSKTEAEAQGGGSSKDAIQYANSIPIIKIGGTYQIEIINPVHYASYVEYGHRQRPGRYVPGLGKQLKEGWVPGKFMLTVSEQELDRQAPKVIEKKIAEFLGECFDA